MFSITTNVNLIDVTAATSATSVVLAVTARISGWVTTLLLGHGWECSNKSAALDVSTNFTTILGDQNWLSSSQQIFFQPGQLAMKLLAQLLTVNKACRLVVYSDIIVIMVSTSSYLWFFCFYYQYFKSNTVPLCEYLKVFKSPYL